MKRYHGCKLFKCDGCSKYKTLSQINEVKALYTSFSRESENEHRYHVVFIALCNECREKAKPKKKNAKSSKT